MASQRVFIYTYPVSRKMCSVHKHTYKPRKSKIKGHLVSNIGRMEQRKSLGVSTWPAQAHGFPADSLQEWLQVISCSCKGLSRGTTGPTYEMVSLSTQGAWHHRVSEWAHRVLFGDSLQWTIFYLVPLSHQQDPVLCTFTAIWINLERMFSNTTSHILSLQHRKGFLD